MAKLPPYILTDPTSGRHLYKRGWFGLIPLIGFFVGVGLLVLGIVRYRDKKLIWIGIGAMSFSVLVYGSMFIYLNSESFRKETAPIAQRQLDNLVKDIEFYKLKKGQYPDSIEQLATIPYYTSYTDPLSARVTGKYKPFNYHRSGEHYTIFSSGIDKTANTKDDLYPTIDTAGLGLIKKTSAKNNP